MKVDRRISLDRPETYRVEVQGRLDDQWQRWAGNSFEVSCVGPLVTTLVGKVDQAGLHGALRRLYGLGLPIISVECLDPDRDDAAPPCDTRS